MIVIDVFDNIKLKLVIEKRNERKLLVINNKINVIIVRDKGKARERERKIKEIIYNLLQKKKQNCPLN